MDTFAVHGSGPAAYEEYLVPVLFAPLAHRVLDAAGLGAGDRLLDVACGTGIVARTAATRGARCAGVDLNQDMLATAKALGPGLEWLDGDAAALPVPDESYDVVTCQQGLQFMPDPVAVLRELVRVLRPGGRLVLATWRRLEYAPGFAAYVEVLDRHLGTEAGDILRAPFGLGDPERLRALLGAAGLAEHTCSIEALVCRFASIERFFAEEVAATPLAEPVGAADEEVKRRMVLDLAAALADRVDDRGLVFPIETHVVTAVR